MGASDMVPSGHVSHLLVVNLDGWLGYNEVTDQSIATGTRNPL